jgi:dipeptidyl aminopeptidase/acylaminoacyl peptidase
MINLYASMKTILKAGLLLTLASLLLLTSGCGVRRIAWSPDGKRAAVLGQDGLYFCDADGKLSGVQVSNVAMTEWFADSQRLAIIRAANASSWPEIEAHLRAEERVQIVQQGQAVWREMSAGHEWKGLLNLFDHPDAVVVYLKTIDGVNQKIGPDLPMLQQKEATVFALSVGTIKSNQVILGPALVETLQQPLPMGLRVSPSGAAIALTTVAGKRHGARLLVAASDGSAPGQIVSEEACAHPDWSKDGRSLLYVNATGAMASEDDMRLGELTRRQVINAAGAVEVQNDHDDLAVVLFDVNLGVRALADGRILFVALDVPLPVTAPEMPQQPQIFAYDPNRRPPLTRVLPRKILENLPQDISFFELSPDDKKVLMAADKGIVMVLTLADAAVTVVQGAGGEDAPAFPCWRGSDEICYFSPSPSNTAGHAWEVALWKNGTNRVISPGWPAEIRKGFLDK